MNYSKIAVSLHLVLGLSFAVHAQKKITLSGTLDKAPDGKIIVVQVTSTHLQAAPKQEEVKLSPEGKFSITLPVTETYNWIILANGRQRFDFMAKQGSDLVIQAEATDLAKTVNITGKGNEVPNFFARFSKDKGGLMNLYRSIQELSGREPDEFERALDSLQKAELAYLNQDQANLPKDFIQYWSDVLLYAGYEAALNYPSIHEMIKQQTNNITSIPVALFSVTRKVPKAFDDKKLGMNFYQNYAQAYFSAKLAAEGYPQPGLDAQSIQPMDSVLKLIYSQAPKKTAELIAGRTILKEAASWSPQELEARVNTYKKQFPGSKHNASLDEAVKEVIKFNPGQPAIDFAFQTLEGKDMKLSDLKGKVVYLDFWASWCGPCKGEMPHAKKIKEHFQDKDVVFLYVSIDDKEDAWKRGIEAMDISGIHARTPGWGGPIAKLYKVQSVPAYYLIDKKGNFVLRQTPRPSQSAQLIQEIEQLLQ